jgi:hypothetical protein
VARYLILFFVEIYRLVHSFLVAHAHEKAGKAVRKAAKDVRIKDIKKTSHTSLENVLQEWQQNKKDVESLKGGSPGFDGKVSKHMRAQSTATQAKSSSSESSGGVPLMAPRPTTRKSYDRSISRILIKLK